MKYVLATINDSQRITDLVQKTIEAVYPKYYPKEVVKFFLNHHSFENIKRDIEKQLVGMLMDGEKLVGTGCYDENHITRVYVLPEFQGMGYGSYIISKLEDIIAKKYDSAKLDASLPACGLYARRGYQTVAHGSWNCENGVVLVYEIMKKELHRTGCSINYDGRYFVPKVNSENGEVDHETEFSYHQNGNIMWAEYTGGDIIKGYMIGTVEADGKLDFTYQHININHEVRIGKCHSVPKINENGKIELQEEWQWLNGDLSQGVSIVIER